MRFTFASMALTAALAGLLAGAAPAQAQVKLVMSNDNNALGVKGRTFEFLKSDIEKRLGGKVQVELHHSGTLFDQQTQIQGLQLGSVQMIAPTQGIYAAIAPKINALSLPFLLSSPKAIDAAMNDPMVRKIFIADMQRKNIEPVAVWINGPRQFSYRGTKPILLPSDMKGVKMRVQAVPVDVKTMEALGANVVTLPWTEVPTALQQGVIDAVEPTPNALMGAGLGELITQMTKVAYQYSFYIVGVNKQWWDGLSPEIRDGLKASLVEATKWNWENTTKDNDAAYAKLEAMGKKINSLTPAQRAEWVKAVAPVWKQFGEPAVGADVMARLQKIGEENP